MDDNFRATFPSRGRVLGMRSKVLLASLFDHVATLLISPLTAILASPAKDRLWNEIGEQQLGVPFRRQVVIGAMIVDFLAPGRKLVILVEEAFQKRNLSSDAAKDQRLRRLGYRVLRVPAWSVDFYLATALEKIRKTLSELS